MALPEEFWQRLPKRDDRELYEMLEHSGDYLPEALAAIRSELERRNLPAETVVQLKELAVEKKAEEEDKANQPLGWFMRISILLIGLPGISLLYYQATGQTRKRKDAIRWFLFCLLFWFSINLLSIAARIFLK